MLPPDIQEWDDIACESYKLKRVLVENDKARIKLFSPGGRSKFYCTAPYFYDGGINLNDNKLHEDTLSALKELIIKENLNYILLKSREIIDTEINEQIKIHNDYFTFLLDLSEGEDSVWNKKLKSTTRNQVRKAQKLDFEVRIGHDELLHDFYSVISEGWRDLGTPTHGRVFYSSILENMKKKAGLIVINYQGKPISCALLLMVDNVIYHPYSCTLKDYKSTCVNNLLYWEIIKFACKNGFEKFDMGRSHKNQGTYKYKKSWGGEPIMLFYTYIINSGSEVPSFDSSFYKCATSLWKYMPLSMANALGPSLIKNIL